MPSLHSLSFLPAFIIRILCIAIVLLPHRTRPSWETAAGWQHYMRRRFYHYHVRKADGSAWHLDPRRKNQDSLTGATLFSYCTTSHKVKLCNSMVGAVLYSGSSGGGRWDIFTSDTLCLSLSLMSQTIQLQKSMWVQFCRGLKTDSEKPQYQTAKQSILCCVVN